MKSKCTFSWIRLWLAALILTGSSSMVGGAQEPGEKQQYVLLHTGRVLHGELVQSLDHWTLQMEAGARVRLDTSDIDLIGDSQLHLYHQLQQRTQRNQLEQRVEIVKFCIRHNLLEEAGREIDWLLQDGLNEETGRRLTASVEVAQQRLVLAAKRTTHPPASTPSTLRPGPPTPQSLAAEGDAAADPTEDASYVEEEFATFVRFAQPHLLLGCAKAQCHGSQATTAFEFQRLELGATPTRKMSQANYVMLKRWLQSNDSTRLLDLATQAHGGLREPVWGTEDLGARILQAWTNSLSLALPEQVAGGAASPSAVRPVSFTEAMQGGSSTEATAEPQGSTEDPYDPSLFNLYIKNRAQPIAEEPLPEDDQTEPGPGPNGSQSQPISSPPRKSSKNE